MAGFTWPDGSRGHTIPWAQHKANMEAAETARHQQAANTQAANNQRAAAGGGTTPGWIPSTINGAWGGAAGAAPAPVGAAPAAPEAPAPAPRKPFQWTPDSDYNAEVALNAKKKNDTLSEIDDAEHKTKFEFGIDDPTNANSRANALKELYLKNVNAARTSMNSRGQLFSGANLRAIDRNSKNNDRANADLRAAYEEALTRLRNLRTKAGNDEEEANLGARNRSGDRQRAAYDGS